MMLTEQALKHVFLADDDDDDRLLFKDVLNELSVAIKLTIAKNGDHLMNLLGQIAKLPDVLFLDLNMPLKNGFECLEEIKSNDKLKDLPVVIFSTSMQPSAIDEVYRHGARLYVRKPNDFTQLKKIVQYVVDVNWDKKQSQPSKEEFVLTV